MLPLTLLPLLTRDVQEPPTKRQKTQPSPSYRLEIVNAPLEAGLGAQLAAESMLEKFLENVQGKHKSWNSKYAACKWSGVKCDKYGNVRNIDWGKYPLEGTNLTWGYLPSTLTHLDMDGKKRKKYVPAPMLRGEVPSAALPRSLVKLRIGHNAFSGVFDLTNLPVGLKKLTLRNNAFEGPCDFTQLPVAMKKLYLSHNLFSGPVDVTKLPQNMKKLDLEHNLFVGEVDVKTLPKGLKLLNLLQNNFTSISRPIPSVVKVDIDLKEKDRLP